MEGRVKVLHPQNICGSSQQKTNKKKKNVNTTEEAGEVCPVSLQKLREKRRSLPPSKTRSTLGVSVKIQRPQELRTSILFLFIPTFTDCRALLVLVPVVWREETPSLLVLLKSLPFL